MKRKLFFKFSAPSNLTMITLMLIPLGVAVFLSLHFVTFVNINTPKFVGLSNYAAILTDPQFWQAFRFSMVILIIAVPIQIVLGFCMALLLDQIRSIFRGVILALILLPFVVVPVVGTLMFKHFIHVIPSRQYGNVPFFHVSDALGLAHPCRRHQRNIPKGRARNRHRHSAIARLAEPLRFVPKMLDIGLAQQPKLLAVVGGVEVVLVERRLAALTPLGAISIAQTSAPVRWHCAANQPEPQPTSTTF